MGAWGTSLYANDAASDIRGDYLDGLRRGKSNEELTRELVAQYSDPRDPEEDALFWFALADTQWNYGRLLPEVLERALYYLPLESSCERWAEEGEKKLAAWKGTLDKLEKKIVQQEAMAEAFTELNAAGVAQAAVADEFEQLQHKDAVDTELERLKAELGMA